MKMMFGFLYALTTLNKVTKTIILSIMFELKWLFITYKLSLILIVSTGALVG
jgi:hypothetical protein